MTTSKRLNHVDLLIELLYTNSAAGKTSSHVVIRSPTKHQSKSPRLRFATSVWPSVWGWYAVENLSAVLIFFQRVRQKWLVKRTSCQKQWTWVSRVSALSPWRKGVPRAKHLHFCYKGWNGSFSRTYQLPQWCHVSYICEGALKWKQYWDAPNVHRE